MLIHYVMLWPWPLTPWTSAVNRTSHGQTLYQIWAKSNNSRLRYWRFSNFKGRISKLCFSDGGQPNRTKFEENRAQSPLEQMRNFGTDWLIRLEMGVAKKSEVENQGQISHFLTPVNITGGMGRMLRGMIELILRLNLWYIHLTSSYWAVEKIRDPVKNQQRLLSKVK